jgi:hypothetical protein
MHAVDKTLADADSYTAAVPITGWTGTGPFTRTVTVAALTADDKTLIDLDLSATPFASVASVQNAYALIYRAEPVAGGLTLYATAVPSTAFNLTVVVL